MSIEGVPDDPANPNPAVIADKKEEVDEWRTLISDLTTSLGQANAKIAALETQGASPEMTALQEKVTNLEAELTEAKQGLTEAQASLKDLSEKGEGVLRIPETLKEGSSGQTDQSDPKPAQTRASRLGWI